MVSDLVKLPRPVDNVEERSEIMTIVIRILQHRKPLIRPRAPCPESSRIENLHMHSCEYLVSRQYSCADSLHYRQSGQHELVLGGNRHLPRKG